VAFLFSINVLTLLAIVLAGQVVVDDGIVPKIFSRKSREGMTPIRSGNKRIHEIFFAVISISVTCLQQYFTVIFLEGFVGRLFREFGVVIGAAVLISAFVS
jgi:HAE1 family hydrophobic/amphiphilic exporter-1/multidrug efflux pump